MSNNSTVRWASWIWQTSPSPTPYKTKQSKENPLGKGSRGFEGVSAALHVPFWAGFRTIITVFYWQLGLHSVFEALVCFRKLPGFRESSPEFVTCYRQVQKRTQVSLKILESLRWIGLLQLFISRHTFSSRFLSRDLTPCRISGKGRKIRSLFVKLFHLLPGKTSGNSSTPCLLAHFLLWHKTASVWLNPTPTPSE